MKKNASLLFLFILSIYSFSQSKYIQKSEKLFKKGKYEKCIKASKKFMSKSGKSPELQSFIVSSNLSLFKLEKNKSKKYSYLKRTIKSWERLVHYNTSKTSFKSLEDSIVSNIYTFSKLEYTQRNRTKVKFLHQSLAEVYNDTTDIYRSLFAKQVPVEEIKINESLIGIRTQLLQNAKQLIGVKYKYGGIDSTGFDCSGYTQYVYKSVGIELPHNANAQSGMGKTIDLKDAKPGDLIFFGNKRAFHAGIIFNNNKGEIELIHCVSGGVHHQTYDNQNTKYWLQRVYKVERIIND